MSQSRKVELHGEKKRLLDDFFKVDEYHVSYEVAGGELSAPQRLLVFDRGDAVAALLFDPERRKVLVVEQFRLPTYESSLTKGWLIEAPAGMIRPGETPEQCLWREVLEETGYHISNPAPITTFYSSPGGSTERIFLFYAEIRRDDRKTKGGGVAADGEDIKLIEIDLDEISAQIRDGRIADPKLIIGVQWLRDHLWRRRIEADRTASERKLFVVRGTTHRIGYAKGDIIANRGIDVWVNSENTDMMMDRFFAKSVSAAIRYHGARKFRNSDRVDEDTIAEALRREADREKVAGDTIAEDLKQKLGGRNFAALGSVLETTSGALEASHGVRRLFHVAAVEGQIGSGVNTSIPTLELCIDEALEAIERRNRPFPWLGPVGRLLGKRYRSALIPMIGTGEGGFLVTDVAPRLIARAVRFLKERPDAVLSTIYFSAYSYSDVEVCEAVLSGSKDVEPITT